MSIEVSRWVWVNSKSKGTARLVMLAIADHAHDDGGGAYPGFRGLAEKINTSERNVKILVKKLEADGELEIRRGKGPRGTNVYRVKNFRPESQGQSENSTPRGEKSAPERGEDSSLKPSLVQPSLEPLVVETFVEERNGSGGSVRGGATPPPTKDPITLSCLEVLKRIPRFPRDQAHVAKKLTEYREDFPLVDAVMLCKDYLEYCEYKKKRDPSPRQLRFFFKSETEKIQKNQPSERPRKMQI